MTERTKQILLVLIFFVLCGIMAWAQAPSPPPSTPILSTADRVALTTLEQKKQEAQKLYEDAQRGEMTILQEWEALHPGWKLDPKTFAVVKEQKMDLKK